MIQNGLAPQRLAATIDRGEELDFPMAMRSAKSWGHSTVAFLGAGAHPELVLYNGNWWNKRREPIQKQTNSSHGPYANHPAML